MSTKITIATQYGTVSVEVPQDDLALPELVEVVLRPALLGSGYAERTVNEVLGDD